MCHMAQSVGASLALWMMVSKQPWTWLQVHWSKEPGQQLLHEQYLAGSLDAASAAEAVC